LNAVANGVSTASNAASGMGAASAAGYGSQAVMPDAEGAVCVMRPGDVGFEECEACQ
jgi:ribonucleoside-diphosphate reductase alpha chain